MRERERMIFFGGISSTSFFHCSLTLFLLVRAPPYNNTSTFEKKNQLRLLKAGARADAGDYDNRTALHIAAAEGNVPAIEILLAGGADCGPTDRWQATPLLEAVKAKRAAAIDALLARGAAASGLGIDENALSGLLCSAAEAKDAELIALYIKAGAPCDAGDYDKR